MTFDEPLPFSEAMDRLESKGLLPTDLSSAEIREQWDSGIIERSIFSARTTKAEILQGYKDQLGDIIGGKVNLAKAREVMQDMFESLDYDSEHGHFGGEEDAMIPYAERGSLRDLSSEKRVNLVLETQLGQLANYGYWTQAMESDAVWSWPCFELVRIESRRVPRGLRKAKGGALVPDPGNDWPSRWEACGGSFYGGRMIARKDDPIWDHLGDPDLFPDGLGQPYPPFAFNSGFGIRAVRRSECIALGVIGGGDRVQPLHRGMNEHVEAPVENLDKALLDAVIDGLKVEVKDGNAILQEELAKARAAYGPTNKGRLPK